MNLYLFGHPRATWVFSKLQGLQQKFPENFSCNLKFYGGISLFITFSNPKILGYLFLRKRAKKKLNLGSELQKIRRQKMVGIY